MPLMSRNGVTMLEKWVKKIRRTAWHQPRSWFEWTKTWEAILSSIHECCGWLACYGGIILQVLWLEPVKAPPPTVCLSEGFGGVTLIILPVFWRCIDYVPSVPAAPLRGSLLLIPLTQLPLLNTPWIPSPTPPPPAPLFAWHSGKCGTQLKD